MAFIDDLRKFQLRNQRVVLELQNGKSRTGVIVSIEELGDPPTVTIQDVSGEASTISIRFINLIDPVNESGENDAAVTVESKLDPLEMVNPEKKRQRISRSVTLPPADDKLAAPQVLAYRLRLESTFDAEARVARLEMVPPDFNTPPEIKGLNYANTSEEPRDWTFIKNKYDYARKMGRLAPQSEDLTVIINRCKKLLENSALHNSPVFHGYLGYFLHLNGSRQEAVQALQKAAKISDHPQDWFNLAAVALDLDETEQACYALCRLFLQASTIQDRYENAWYKFSELINRTSYYQAIGFILHVPGRVFRKEEYQRIFEAVCYSLIKCNMSDKADILIAKVQETGDYHGLISEGLMALPKETTQDFANYKSNFERMTVKYVAPPQNAKKPAYPASKQSDTSALRDADLHKAAWKAWVYKDYDNAETWFRQAINKNVNKAAAVRDLAMMLDSLKRTNEALEILERHTDHSDNDKNILYTLYVKVEKYDQAIKVKQELYTNYDKALNAGQSNDSITAIRNKKVTMLSEIARAYFCKKQFEKAVEYYKRALGFAPNDLSIKRNIPICWYKKGDISKALEELRKLANEGDKKSLELLIAIESAPGSSKQDTKYIEVMIANMMSQRSTDLDSFAQYYLDRCSFKGVPPERLENGKYRASDKDVDIDIEKLERATQALGTTRPGERSEFMLSAARIIFDNQSNEPYFYRHLFKSFTSRADSAVYERKALDSIKTLYLEALKLYDAFTEDYKEKKDKTLQFDEQDAVNAMYRYLYAQLGAGEIPVDAVYISTTDTLEKQKKLIRDSFNKVFNLTFETWKSYDRIMEAVRILLVRSPQYGSLRLLHIIMENPKWTKTSVQYLNKLLPDHALSESPSFEEFAKAWQEAANLLLKLENDMAFQVGALRQFSLSDTWLNDAVKRIDSLLDNEFVYPLDLDYLKRLGNIVDDCLSYINASSYDDRISRHGDLENRCKRLLEDLEKNPTRFAIEDVFPVVGNIQQVLRADIDRFYEENKASLSFESVVSAYILKDDQSVDVQITIKNQGAGHAEQLQLRIHEDPAIFRVPEGNIIMHGTVRGGTQDVILVNFVPAESVKQAKVFSFTLECDYKTRRGEHMQVASDAIAIQIGSAEDFIPIIPNPYAEYASADVVDKAEMFFGREQFIVEAYETICNNYKSFAISGQKRAGKSSVLFHLGRRLKANPNLLVADIGNIGRFFDKNSKRPLLYQILGSILYAIKESLEEHQLFNTLAGHIPDLIGFFNDETPVVQFGHVLSGLKKKMGQVSGNPNARVILLIDEFTYVYYYMVSDEVKDKLGIEFLKNWKALLEMRLFSIVIVGQDYFQKLVQLDPNTFAMIEHRRISYLEREAAAALIQLPMSVSHLPGTERLTAGAIQRIYDLTAGSPYYIQIFCNQLVAYVNREKVITITEANVNHVLKNALLKGINRLDILAFDNMINDGDPSPDAIHQEDSLKVLNEVARLTKNQLYCNRRQLNCTTEKPQDQIIRWLIEREVIEQNRDGHLRIRVELFKEWLLGNYI